ncbi:MAG: mannose-1-phosphate guanylyltransferase [Candidatus Latescibacteria bacterium]|jgi:mannose-1-phosphate guanylyltransferase|nr:mannose-1-phosphate guanylyltransferase [Candidatus Latescibacterota bacterium]MBT5832840.1 mannose-1-phosphate guanylyltransferase [Candidatus Latescibacterota bacterium]
MKIVIRAGGIGTRLWPFSRQTQPKQFHALVGTETMVQEAVSRVMPIADIGDIFVSTGTDLVGIVSEQLPAIPSTQVIVEPALRNTGPAVGLECILLETRYPGCTVASLGSDHHIGKPEEFCRLLKVAADALEDMPENLFTIGVKPTRVDTGFGYIQKGDVAGTVNDEPIYAVNAFTEKPDAERAQTYVESGQYLWNSNMFVWKARTVLDLFEEYEPEIYVLLQEIGAAVGTEQEAAVIEAVYPKMKEIAVDNAIIERAPQVVTLEADIDWSDIGSWGALTDVLPVDDQGNLINGNVVALNTNNVTVYGGQDKIIALVDVDNLIVVDTGDALLILPRDGSQRVRDVVGALKEQDGGDRYC